MTVQKIEDWRQRPTPVRRDLPPNPPSASARFSDDGGWWTVTAYFYEDGKIGRVTLAMEGVDDITQGFVNIFTGVVSCALQHGIPFEVLAEDIGTSLFQVDSVIFKHSPNQEMMTGRRIAVCAFQQLRRILKGLGEK